MKTPIFSLITLVISISSFAQVSLIIGTGNLCNGSNITLTDATSGGNWSSNNPSVAAVGSANGIVTGIADGIATISYAVGIEFATFIVTVNPLPDVFIVTGGGSICQGSAGLHIGLTGSNTGVTYQLNNDGTAMTNVVGTGTFLDFGLQNANGVYGVVATSDLTGCSKSMTGTSIINVNPIPLPISGPSAICDGSIIDLPEFTYGGTWSSSMPTIASIGLTTGIVTGLSTGSTTIYYTLPTGCFTSKTIIVNYAPPPISGVSSVCQSSSIIISDPIPGGFWISSNPSIATIGSLSGIVTGISPGTVDVSYELGGLSCIVSKSVTVNAATCSGTPDSGTALSSDSLVCINTPVTLTLFGASTGCEINYQWQNSADGISFTDIIGATNINYECYPTTSFFYRCKVRCVSTGLFSYSSPKEIRVHNTIVTHNLINLVDTTCITPDFYIASCGSNTTSNVTTWFGDGTSENLNLSTSGTNSADFLHSYTEPGTYSIKQVLYSGYIPQDSILFSYEFSYCRNLPVKFYFDANSDCVFDSGDKIMTLPIVTEIDSNGVPVDTISSTSGFYYKALGDIGTVYGFRIIKTPASVYNTCPTSGILYDTIVTSLSNSKPRYFGFNCTGTGFDLGEYVSTNTGRHRQLGTIVVDNSSCLPNDIIVTLQFSPKYYFHSSVPSPANVSANTAVWYFTGISSTNLPVINYWLELPPTSAFLPLYDTVNSVYRINGSLSGDLDSSSNVIFKTDTVQASLDPNEISVSPEGNILPCTLLDYTISFENTGNDTAHNIYILDTLSNNLDVHSLSIDIASSVMNFVMIKKGGFTVAKFDLPNINLPDSSHHNLANGMVTFSIKSKQGLTDGTVIQNHAGIYFDDNPVVLTNVVSNVIGINPIIGTDSVCTGGHDTLFNKTKGGIWSSTNATATVAAGIISGIVAGTDTISYSLSNSCAIKTAKKNIIVKPLPYAGLITGDNALCVGSVTNLSDSTSDGTWTSNNVSKAAISTLGVVNGISAGIVNISYSVTNNCGTTKISKELTVNPLPENIEGVSNLCLGSTSLFADSSAGGVWSSNNPIIANIGTSTGFVTGTEVGTSICSYTLATGCFTIHTLSVNPLPIAYYITGGGGYCLGGDGTSIELSGSDLGIDYQLYCDTALIASSSGSGSPINFGLQTTIGSYRVIAINSVSTCQNNMVDSAFVTTIPVVTPSLSLFTIPGDTICMGTSVNFTAIPVNGGSIPIYNWQVNGVNVGSGNTYSYVPEIGDVVRVQLKSDAICVSPDTVSKSIGLIVISPLTPIVSIVVNPNSIIVSGQTVTLSASVKGRQSSPAYQWVVNHTYIAGATDSFYTSNNFSNNDSVTCIVTTSNECGSVIAEKTVAVLINTDMINQILNSNSISIFPNPATGVFTIENAAGCDMKILNSIGQELYLTKINSARDIVDTQFLISGIYLVQVKSLNGELTYLRLVIK